MFTSEFAHSTTIRVVGVLSALTFLLVTSPANAAQPVFGDLNGDGSVNAVDIQLVINAALGIVSSVSTPNVVGMTQSSAQAAIVAAGLVVGTVTLAQSATVPAGSVVSQNPAAGTSVLLGSAVDLEVSTEPQLTENIMLPGNVPLTMVWIPAGTFMMGRYPGEQSSYSEEGPRHQVTLTHGFYLGKYELTQQQWQAVMNTTPWAGQSYVIDDPEIPAVYVSWNDAQGFIAALNSLTGKTFRLPSEAEWEYACRAGTTWWFYWGDDPSYTQIGNYAWYMGNAAHAGQQYAHVVGQKLPNAWGLYDMSGNVLEWCQDWWHDNYTGAPTDGSAWESPTSSYRVLRGGGWGNAGGLCRSAYRSYSDPAPVNIMLPSIGLRVVRTP